MKRALFILAQFLLFLLVDLIGSFVYHPFHLQTSLASTPPVQRSFVWDGLVLLLLVYLLILVIEAATKRLRSTVLGSTLALALAALVGYIKGFGFITHNW